MRDELEGWYNALSVAGQCAFCKYKLSEGHALVACEYGKPAFPRAKTCAFYEPEDLDE